MPVFPFAAVVSTAAIVRFIEPVWARTLGIGLLCLAFIFGPFVHIAEPDYSPQSRSVAERVIKPLPLSTRFVVWESYDPAMFYYGGRGGEIWTSDPRFYEIQQSVHMMRRSQVVKWADASTIDALVKDPRTTVIVSPKAREASLQPIIVAAQGHRDVSGHVEGDFVVVTMGSMDEEANP
jgi:hypothetical protein